MKIVSSKINLAQIINIVQKAVSSKTSYPILDCIKIDASSDGNVTFTSNCIDLCIEYNSETTVLESGSIALPSKIFGELIRRMPDGDVTISSNPSNYITDIYGGSSKVNIQGMSAEEFPPVPIIDEEYGTKLSQGDLKQIIRKVFPFVSQLETRKPILMGALFDFKDEELCVVGTD